MGESMIELYVTNAGREQKHRQDKKENRANAIDGRLPRGRHPDKRLTGYRDDCSNRYWQCLGHPQIETGYRQGDQPVTLDAQRV